MGANVFSGIAITKIIGLSVLGFAHSEIFRVYFFRMYMGIVVISLLHALLFMPALLTLIGMMMMMMMMMVMMVMMMIMVMMMMMIMMMMMMMTVGPPSISFKKAPPTLASPASSTMAKEPTHTPKWIEQKDKQQHETSPLLGQSPGNRQL